MSSSNQLVTIAAPAKLNVRLWIEGRRLDGFHHLSLLNVCVGQHDTITLEGRPSGVSLHIDDQRVVQQDRIPSDPTHNLAGRAAIKFLQRFSLPSGVHIQLTKRLPSGAGLGGGSSDAAAVLKGLVQVFEGNLAHFDKEMRFNQLLSLALELGSDVPYFLYATPQHVTGIGNQHRSIDMSELDGWPCLVIHPHRGLSTPEVYASYRKRHMVLAARPDAVLRSCEKVTPQFLWTLVDNHLEEAAIGLYPELGEMIAAAKKQPDCVVGMTGSGSSFFVLPKVRSLGRLADNLRKYVGSSATVFPDQLYCPRPSDR